MPIANYTDLISRLAACSNDKQVADLPEKHYHVVDETFLHFSEDPAIAFSKHHRKQAFFNTKVQLLPPETVLTCP
ncbi:hypothetical protein [uncultured Chitinophaga sp.]|jgi:hypothetical protein|uniref:hypothetical protein n=1 Tax=uncultured Chitinophaga sp. TaxID=339340 RepID=UPI002632A1DD|nr:hypothetical protein [uncultured Chitinophaga sp.]